MKYTDTYKDIKNMLLDDSIDMDKEDFIDLCGELQDLIARHKDRAQEELIIEIENRTKRFGWTDCYLDLAKSRDLN